MPAVAVNPVGTAGTVGVGAGVLLLPPEQDEAKATRNIRKTANAANCLKADTRWADVTLPHEPCALFVLLRTAIEQCALQLLRRIPCWCTFFPGIAISLLDRRRLQALRFYFTNKEAEFASCRSLADRSSACAAAARSPAFMYR